MYNWTEWKSKLLIVYDKYDHKLRSILQLVFVIFQVYLLLCGNEDKNVEYNLCVDEGMGRNATDRREYLLGIKLCVGKDDITVMRKVG